MMRNWYNMEKIVVNFDNVDNSTGSLEILNLYVGEIKLKTCVEDRLNFKEQ